MSLHRLPKPTEVRKLWIEALQLDGLSSNKCDNFYVCGDHFANADFREGLSKRILCYSAVPSVIHCRHRNRKSFRKLLKRNFQLTMAC